MPCPSSSTSRTSDSTTRPLILAAVRHRFENSERQRHPTGRPCCLRFPRHQLRDPGPHRHGRRHRHARSEGVDCDGNGSIDISAGSVLVREISDVESDGGPQPGSPRSSRPSERSRPTSTWSWSPAITSRSSRWLPRYPSVDITDRNSLGFDLTFTCRAAWPEPPTTSRWRPRSRELRSPPATAKVVCQEIPVAPGW